MKITGTIVNYFIHCKRQCWLFANKINLEDNSEEVRIGKILHEIKNENVKNKEVSIENIKIDDTMSRKWTKEIEISARTLSRYRLLASPIL